MNRIDHIGIAVKDLQRASETYARLLGKPSCKTERVAAEQVQTAFFDCGDTKLELLAATGEDSVLTRFIEKRGEGVHHIAFLVEDIQVEIDRLKREGFDFISEEPKPGADNKLICFLHPRGLNGVLVELCEEIG